MHRNPLLSSPQHPNLPFTSPALHPPFPPPDSFPASSPFPLPNPPTPSFLPFPYPSRPCCLAPAPGVPQPLTPNDSDTLRAAPVPSFPSCSFHHLASLGCPAPAHFSAHPSPPNLYLSSCFLAGADICFAPTWSKQWVWLCQVICFPVAPRNRSKTRAEKRREQLTGPPTGCMAPSNGEGCVLVHFTLSPCHQEFVSAAARRATKLPLNAPRRLPKQHSGNATLQLATIVLLAAASAIYRLQVKGSFSSAVIATPPNTSSASWIGNN